MKNIYRHIFRAFLVIGLFIIGEGVMWGSSHYAKVTASANPTGKGIVYVRTTFGSYSSAEAKSDDGGSGSNATFYIKADNVADGYHLVNWECTSANKANLTFTDASKLETSLQAKRSTTDDGTEEYTIRANFAENFYATLSLGTTAGTSGTPTGGGTKNVETSGGNVTFDNITAPAANTGYHFSYWTGVGVSFGAATSTTTSATVKAATTGGSGNAQSYTATANYVENRYYSTVNLSINGSGSAKIEGSSGSTKYTTTPSSSVTYNLGDVSAQNGWHFAQWNKKTSPGTCSFGKNTDKVTTFTAATPANYDDDNKSPFANALVYEIECKFVENYHTTVSTNVLVDGVSATKGGKAYVTLGTSISESVTTTTANDGYGQEWAKDVDYAVRAVPDAGYHFVGWTIDNTSESTIVSPSNTTSQLKVKAVNSKQGASNPNAFVITASFEKDMYNAKLTTSVSSSSDASSSTAQVSKDNSNWSGSVSVSASSGNKDVTFYVKATPAAGYKFIGWSETNGSSTTISGLGATGTYTVKSAATQGETNAKNLYAIFKKEYSIVIKANGTASAERIAFSVTGPATYRVSVPVGEQIILKDVTPGTYTVTPEKGWSWAYTVTPESQTTSYDSENKSTHNFTVTPKAQTKGHDEAVSTITISK